MCWLLAVAQPAALFAVQTSAGRWAVGPKPITVIGISEGDPERELTSVTSAHRLSTGSVVVANGKPLELRMFTAAGTFVRRIGREGDGPGEFRSEVRIFAWPGDSLLTFTSGNRRWALFTPAGTLVREWELPGRTSPADLLLYGRTFTVRGVNAPAACVRAVAERLPATMDPVREIFADAAGHFWVRGPGMRAWQVYAFNGTPIAVVGLPADAQLLEVGGGAAVVRARDADDVERVEVWRVAMPGNASPITGRCRDVADSSVHPPFGLVPAMMRTDLRNMRLGADDLFRRTGHYPATVPEFGITFSKGAETEVRVLMSDQRGWGAVITDKKTGVYCMSFFGASLVPGWPSGSAACALPASPASPP